MLRRIGLWDLCEALSSTCPVRRKGRERWAGGRTPKNGRRVSTSVLFTRGMLMKNAVRSVHALADQHGQVALGLFVGYEVLACLVCSACARACVRGL